MRPRARHARHASLSTPPMTSCSRHTGLARSVVSRSSSSAASRVLSPVIGAWMSVCSRGGGLPRRFCAAVRMATRCRRRARRARSASDRAIDQPPLQLCSEGLLVPHAVVPAANHSVRVRAQVGPVRTRVRSSTRMPDNGRPPSWNFLTADPFDRMLVAHSLARRMPLCTVDRCIRTHHRLIVTAYRHSVTQPDAAGCRAP
jgi:hypothetical protein